MHRSTAAVMALAAAASAAFTTTTPDPCQTRTVCADYINECGIWYGGCFPDCTPWPTFTPPPCPSSRTGSTTSTSSPPVFVTSTRSQRPCSSPTASSSVPGVPYATAVPPATTPAPYPAHSPPGSSLPCGGKTSCATSYRTCPATTITFGGCYPACSPKPFYTPPPCPVSTSMAA